MKKLFKQVSGDKIVKWAVLSSAGLLLLQLIYLLIIFLSLPPYIPLFNQMTWGQERLGTRIEIILPFLITVAFFIINFFLATHFYDKMPLVSRIIGITSLLVTILTLLFVLRTTQLIL